jgi:nucleoside-diphosphate-sugar epimerase
MRIVIPGGSGQIGSVLARYFHEQGHSVTVLSRAPRPAPWQVLPWTLAHPARGSLLSKTARFASI